MKKMSRISRIICAIAVCTLMGSFFLPVWQIDLSAPQYPEGLSMQIWLDKITGQVDIINGLNHYIGMKHISADMFPEFDYLVYVVAVMIALGFVVAVSGKLSFLFSYILLLILCGTAAMVDFYQWGYDYGHNLDPTAAIQVPGLTYQPPLIGHKQLLNFDAYSYPAAGGWIIVTAGLTLIILWLIEYTKARKATKRIAVTSLNKRSVAAFLSTIFLLSSCETKPEAFILGKDGCHFCKMTIITPGFGGEIITKKAKIYKFDDLHCLIGFLKTGEVKEDNIAHILAIDYNKHNFLNVEQASFVVAEGLHSPMNSNAAAFATPSAASEINQTFKGQLTNWENLVQTK